MAVALTLTSCMLFDKVDDIAFETEMVKEFIINENNKGREVSYKEVAHLDATDNIEVAKLSNKIKSIDVKRITYQITEYTSPGKAVITSAVLSYLAGTAETQVGKISELNLKEVFNNASVIELPVQEVALKQIADILKSTKKLTFNLSGLLSEAPVKFKVKIMIDVKIVAEAI